MQSVMPHDAHVVCQGGMGVARIMANADACLCPLHPLWLTRFDLIEVGTG